MRGEAIDKRFSDDRIIVDGNLLLSKFVTAFVIVFALGSTIVLSTEAKDRNIKNIPGEETKAANEEITIELSDEKKGVPVSVPGNILTDMTPEENLENYGKEELAIPVDVEYSDEGRPYSKTYDYRTTPVLNRIGKVLEKEGYEILDPDTEYLDKEGNVQTGRELYVVNAYKEDSKRNMLINVYMVSEDYARDSFSEIEKKDDIWYTDIDDWGGEEEWHILRLYDPQTGVMIDASGNYLLDWEAMGLFDTAQ